VGAEITVKPKIRTNSKIANFFILCTFDAKWKTVLDAPLLSYLLCVRHYLVPVGTAGKEAEVLWKGFCKLYDSGHTYRREKAVEPLPSHQQPLLVRLLIRITNSARSSIQKFRFQQLSFVLIYDGKLGTAHQIFSSPNTFVNARHIPLRSRSQSSALPVSRLPQRFSTPVQVKYQLTSSII
jgi:hypothetical protein